MPLVPGSRLGAYEITAQIGVGGMGEVYRATDTNLKRQVAIKVLPASVAQDAERLARFQREAEVLAQLNHPNIAGIYGLEEADGVKALVMELVEGPTLADRVEQGAIPVEEALPFARQIAEALEAAHEQGIIHRDLKPANIKVRPDGTVKVLDFGLAKAMEPAGAPSASQSMMPTITTPAMTQAGMILGTAAYMSPEQARGKTVDRRADIWAFGAVLFEMLTGARAFEGEDIADTLGNVMKVDPKWDRCPASIPPRVVQVMRACLQKDPKQRMGDMQSVRLALEGVFDSVAAAAPVAVAPRLPLWRRALPVAGATLSTAVVAVLAAWSQFPTVVPSPVNRFSYIVPEEQVFRSAGGTVLAVSPDGRRFVYNAIGGLYVRSLDALEAHVIPGTEASLTSPFFSPDGQSVGYWQDGQLKRIAISGGVPVAIGPAANPVGVSWGRDDAILFGQKEGIVRVPAAGGTPAAVIPAKAGEEMGSPQLLPDGDTVLLTLTAVGAQGDGSVNRIVAQKISTGERTLLVEGGADARYLETGYLLYSVGSVLMGVAFDALRLAVTGSAVPLVQGVTRTNGTPARNYGVAADGTLVWVYSALTATEEAWQLGLSDRTGKLAPLSLQPGAYETPRVSPDGTRVAVGVADPKEAYVAIYDLDGRTALRRLTFGGNNRYPVWSRDGQRVTFQSDREGDLAIFWQRADGAGAAERLTQPEKDTAHVPASWSPKDEVLLFTVIPATDPNRRGAVWTHARASGTAAPFGGVGEGAQQAPTFSPDGRWVAYNLQDGNYIQPFPATGARYQLPRVDADLDGSHPFWSPDGTMLFLSLASGPFLVANVTTQPTVAFGNPTRVPRPFVARTGTRPRHTDIAPDGRLIGLITPLQASLAAGTGAGGPEIRIVTNWFEELKRLVPVK